MNQENVQHLNPTITPSMETTAQALSISHKKTFKDDLFPLCAELFHKVHCPIFVVYPFLMVFFLQVLFVSLWPWSPYWNQAHNTNVMNWLRTIIFYLPVPHDPILHFYSSLVYFLLNLTAIVLIKIQQSYFKYQRKFISFLNYPIRYYFETFMVAMIMPNVVNLGEIFTLIAHGQHPATLIIAFIFTLFNEVFICYSFILFQYLGSFSTFVNISPLLNFDSEFIIKVTYSIRISLFSYFIVNLFENWSYLVIIVLHFGLFLHTLIFLIKEVTFENPFVNGSGFGLFFACLICDIVMFVCHFKPEIPILIPLLHSVFIFGSCVVVGTIFFILRMNFIKKKLSVIKENQQEYNTYFDELGLRYNESKVLTYLRVSFIKCCPCFYNLSLINYISEFYESEKAIAMCLFFVNFFPKEFRIQSKLEKQIMRMREISLMSRFILYQVENLKTLRQFSDNSQARIKLLELNNISRQCEMMNINGLDDSKLDKGYFEGLSSKCARTRAVWREALTSNPNNPKFCEEFCRYLIEAECDFPEALKIKNRQLNIELGKSYSVDHGFRSMVAAFPKYLTEGIVDFNGKIVKNDVTVSNQSDHSNPNDSSKPQKSDKKSTSSSNEYNDSEGTLDTELEEYLGKNYLKLARTRLALHRLLEHKLPKSVRFIRLLFIILVAYIVVIFTLTFVYSLIKSNHQIYNMQQLDYISKSRFYSALSSISLMAHYFKVHGAFTKYLDALQV
ncbi:guanylate cyclase protein, partial [Trichomonas vaginalis G3]